MMGLTYYNTAEFKCDFCGVVHTTENTYVDPEDDSGLRSYLDRASAATDLPLGVYLIEVACNPAQPRLHNGERSMGNVLFVICESCMPKPYEVEPDGSTSQD